MAFSDRIGRAKDAAVLAAKTLGVVGTLAVLGALWYALHAAERADDESAVEE